MTYGKGPDELLFGLSEVVHKPRRRLAMHQMIQSICQRPGWLRTRPSAKDLLRQLDPETLAELVQLLAAGKGRGDAAD